MITNSFGNGSEGIGGIHFEDADLEGRKLGRAVGSLVWEKAQTYIAAGSSLAAR